MVYWIAFPAYIINGRRWNSTRYDTRILKGPLDKLIGRDNYQIFKAGTHPLLKIIKEEFYDKHSLHGAILEIYDVKHIIFLKTALENFEKFTRNRFTVKKPKFYEVEPETILRSEKIISIRVTKLEKQQNLQQALSYLAKIRTAVKFNEAKENFPAYTNRIINGHKDLVKDNNSAIKRLSNRITKLESERNQLYKDLVELWKKQRVDH